MTPETTTPHDRVSAKDAVLALPNILKLLARLLRDPRVDRRRRLVALGAVQHFFPSFHKFYSSQSIVAMIGTPGRVW